MRALQLSQSGLPEPMWRAGGHQPPMPRVARIDRRLTAVENALLDHMGWLAILLFAAILALLLVPVGRSEPIQARKVGPSRTASVTQMKSNEALPAFEPHVAQPVPSHVAAAGEAPSGSPDQSSNHDEERSSSSLAIEEVRPVQAQPTRTEPARPNAQWITGVWAPAASACSKKSAARSGLLPMQVTGDVARAGDTTCVFRSKRRVGNEWVARAECSTSSSGWSSNVKLAVVGDTLRWSSERGVGEYVRCEALRLATRS